MPLCDAPDDATEPTASSQLAEQSQSTGATGGATEAIAAELEASMTLDDVVTELSLHDSRDAQAIANLARTILEGKQAEIRSICKSWGVQRKGINAAGNYGNRSDATLKQELKTMLIKRTMELKKIASGDYKLVKNFIGNTPQYYSGPASLDTTEWRLSFLSSFVIIEMNKFAAKHALECETHLKIAQEPLNRRGVYAKTEIAKNVIKLVPLTTNVCFKEVVSPGMLTTGITLKTAAGKIMHQVLLPKLVWPADAVEGDKRRGEYERGAVAGFLPHFWLAHGATEAETSKANVALLREAIGLEGEDMSFYIPYLYNFNAIAKDTQLKMKAPMKQTVSSFFKPPAKKTETH